MNGKYGDIINLPNHKSKKRKLMSMYDRAAQFASFAALTGYEDAIDETARLTDKKIELTEEQMAELNDKINFICENIKSRPQITVTYFVPDEKKSGGRYITRKAEIKKINMTEKYLEDVNGKTVAFYDIESIFF